MHVQIVSQIDKARVLHVATLTPFYPTRQDETNGCFIAEPLASLAKLGVQNSVFHAQPFYRGSFRSSGVPTPADSISYLSLPGRHGLSTAGAFLFAKVVARFRKLHQEHPIHLIHAHGALPCGHAAMLMAGELGIPFVVSVHGLDVFSTEQVGGRSGNWCRHISERVYRSSRRVICISERVREQVLEGVGRQCRTSVVYNGVDTELFSPSRQSDASSLIVLSVGNLIPIKGHELLIRAVAPLVTEFQTLAVEIIGEGSERTRLESVSAELGIAERVHFLGRQSRQQVAAAMGRCTIFALPSRYEGLGCVYLEAMSTGRAVIGCRGQGIAEVIRHGSTGLLVGPDNEKELSLSLAFLLRDQVRRQNLGAAARDTILDRFTLQQQAENLARIYRECAA